MEISVGLYITNGYKLYKNVESVDINNKKGIVTITFPERPTVTIALDIVKTIELYSQAGRSVIYIDEEYLKEEIRKESERFDEEFKKVSEKFFKMNSSLMPKFSDSINNDHLKKQVPPTQPRDIAEPEISLSTVSKI